jgi:hypothetical protein
LILDVHIRLEECRAMYRNTQKGEIGIENIQIDEILLFAIPQIETWN